MALSVVIPTVDCTDFLTKCLDNIHLFSKNRPEIIIVDNCSEEPIAETFATYKIIRNESNPGFWKSVKQGIDAASNDIVVTMHNDVLIWEQDWDLRIEKEFAIDSQLAMAGFFGAPGLSFDGGRGDSSSNMLGKLWGMSYVQHSKLMTATEPAAVFDSLCMIFRKSYLDKLDLSDIMPHHWTDRQLCLKFIDAGYHLLTIGVAFDHFGSGTAASGKSTLHTFADQWCKDNNIPIDQNGDYTMYREGEKRFQKDFFPRKVIWIDRNFNYH